MSKDDVRLAPACFGSGWCHRWLLSPVPRCATPTGGAGRAHVQPHDLLPRPKTSSQPAQDGTSSSWMPLYRPDTEQTPSDYGPLLGHTTDAWKAPSPAEASNQSVWMSPSLRLVAKCPCKARVLLCSDVIMQVANFPIKLPTTEQVLSKLPMDIFNCKNCFFFYFIGTNTTSSSNNTFLTGKLSGIQLP